MFLDESIVLSRGRGASAMHMFRRLRGRSHSRLLCSSTSQSLPPGGTRIASVEELRSRYEGEAKSFLLPDELSTDFMDEGFVFFRDGQVHAYRNKCAHVTLPLDLDDEDFFSEDKSAIVCKAHGAEYDPLTGICVDGPCKHKSLWRLNISVLDDDVYLFP